MNEKIKYPKFLSMMITFLLCKGYDVDMDREGHLIFLNSVINNKSKILISGYDCELYDFLTESGFNKHNFEVSTISGNFKKKVKFL